MTIYTETEIRRLIAGELALYAAMAHRWAELLAICEPGAVRDAIVRSVARLALMIEEYPSRVAARGPTSPAKLKNALAAESRRVAAQITTSLTMFRAIGIGDEAKS